MKIKITKKLITVVILFGIILTSAYFVLGNSGQSGTESAPNLEEYGLVGYWNFEEGSGQTISDRSGNGNDGTLGADSSVGKDDPVFVAGHDSSGPGGMGMSFDGVDDYVSVGTIDIISYTSISYMAWFKADVLNNARRIISTQWSGTDDIRLFVDGSSIIVAFDDGTVSSVSTPFTDTISWHFVVATYDGSNIRLYLDGSEVGTPATDTFNFAGADGFTNIGRLAGGSAGIDEFDGLIDEVRIYNRALSADEIRMLYNQKKPVLELKFDEGSGTTAHDESFNNNDADFPVADGNKPEWAAP